MTAVTEDTIDDAFRAALAADAGTNDGEVPQMPAPPVKAGRDDPDAPHGRDEQGEPLAPYGYNKRTGRPNIKPGGPGRQGKQDAPRVDERPAETETPASGKPDFRPQLTDLGMSVWIGASALRGGRLLGIPFPDTRPYALMWRTQLPKQVAAWNAAAQQNRTVRSYVEKLSGEDGWSWMIGVGVASVGLVSSMAEMAKASPEIRAQWAEANDRQLEAFLREQMKAMGLEDEDEQEAAA